MQSGSFTEPGRLLKIATPHNPNLEFLMKTIFVTLQERWSHTRHNIHRSKKTYSRKEKHKKGPPKEGLSPVNFSLDKVRTFNLWGELCIPLEIQVSFKSNIKYHLGKVPLGN